MNAVTFSFECVSVFFPKLNFEFSDNRMKQRRIKIEGGWVRETEARG